MRSFDIPIHFRSPIISRVKAKRKEMDARKQDFSPTTLDFGAVKVQLARHFGFCFGVENAIEHSAHNIRILPEPAAWLLPSVSRPEPLDPKIYTRFVS